MADGDVGYGWDGYVVNYELTRELSADERGILTDLVNRLLRPAPVDVIVRELTRLRLLSVTRDQSGDMELLLAAYADELRKYPGDIVVDELRAWPRTGSKYWPSANELISRIERRIRPRTALRDAFQRDYSASRTSPDWIRPTPEEIAESEELLRRHGYLRDANGRWRPPERVPMTSEDRAVMADELARFRERWAFLSQAAVAAE